MLIVIALARGVEGAVARTRRGLATVRCGIRTGNGDDVGMTAENDASPGPSESPRPLLLAVSGPMDRVAVSRRAWTMFAASGTLSWSETECERDADDAVGDDGAPSCGMTDSCWLWLLCLLLLLYLRGPSSSTSSSPSSRRVTQCTCSQDECGEMPHCSCSHGQQCLPHRYSSSSIATVYIMTETIQLVLMDALEKVRPCWALTEMPQSG